MLKLRFFQSRAIAALSVMAALSACSPPPEAQTDATTAPLPFRLHPDNPHYFEYAGKPTALVTSAEHYGALLNLDFDYVAYFAELKAKGLNHTRVFAGTYREVPGDFKIDHNTLAPKPDRFVAPWSRSETPGAADGGAKFDLERWNEAYFARLEALLREAEKRGIIVELTLFCPYYRDSMWEVSPLNAANNVNGVGEVERVDALTLKSAPLVEAQKAVARKIVSELHAVPNLYFEICNEPYARDLVPDDWQREMAAVIAEADRGGPAPHLISQNYSNGSKVVETPNPLVSLFNFHYSRPPDSVAMNYGLNVAIGNNETGFDGSADATYRIQGWDFLFAGGALYNNLDYSFSVGHESGDFAYAETTPGGGSAALRTQLGFLSRYFHALPFVKMAPDPAVVAVAPEDASARALSQPGEVYAIYVHHGKFDRKATPRASVDSEVKSGEFGLDLPAGVYEIVWSAPQTGAELDRGEIDHTGGRAELRSPEYSEDVALVLRAKR